MRQWGKVLVASLLVVFVLQGAVFAQATRFGVRVTDADTGEPLPGANVFLVVKVTIITTSPVAVATTTDD